MTRKTLNIPCCSASHPHNDRNGFLQTEVCSEHVRALFCWSDINAITEAGGAEGRPHDEVSAMADQVIQAAPTPWVERFTSQ